MIELIGHKLRLLDQPIARIINDCFLVYDFFTSVNCHYVGLFTIDHNGQTYYKVVITSRLHLSNILAKVSQFPPHCTVMLQIITIEEVK